MFISIFILILLLPAACLPLVLDTFFQAPNWKKWAYLWKTQTIRSLCGNMNLLVSFPFQKTVTYGRSARHSESVNDLST